MNSWQTRLVQNPELVNVSDWPPIDWDLYSKKERAAILRRQSWVQSVLQGQSIVDVAKSANVAPSTVSKILSRCLGGNDFDPPALTNGLIPYKRTKPYRRQSPLPTLSSNTGHVGAFQQLLDECPGLKDYLNNFLVQSLKQSRSQPNLKPRVFFEAFIKYLQVNNWPFCKYPFTTADLAEESCRKYFHELCADLIQTKSPRHSRRKSIVDTIFTDLEIDEHTVDCTSSLLLEYDIEGESKIYPLRLSRFTLVLARDIACKAMFSPYIVLDKHINQEEFRFALQHFLTPTDTLPKLETPGLQYNVGAGFPTTIGYFRDCLPTIQHVHLDNAMVHLSHMTKAFVCGDMGATLHFGRPKVPLARQIVESAFGMLEVDIHTLPNTAGTNPLDPRRESGKKLKHPPVVSLQALVDVIRFLTANYNALHQAGLHNASPLDVMKWQLEHRLILTLPKERSRNLLRHSRPVRLPVKLPDGSSGSGYVNFHYQKMKGPGLRDPELHGKEVIAMVDDSDLRKFEIFKVDGTHLGWVRSPPTWQQLPYSRSMLTQIYNLVRNSRKLEKASLIGFLEYLLENRNNHTIALSLSKWLSHYLNDPDKAPDLWNQENDLTYSDSQLSDVPETSSYPAWSPKMRNVKSWLDESDLQGKN